jgi:preprotein translocase subunit SecB
MSETQPQPPTFQIEKLYVKDASLEVPHAPEVYMQPVQPQLEVRIDSGANQFADGYFEATVSATVTAKAGERTVFLAEVVQAGVFQMRNVAADDLKPLLGIACPTILFPYLREAISDLVIRGGFPPVVLAPVSFEALYMQRLQQEQGVAAPQGEGPKIELAR